MTFTDIDHIPEHLLAQFNKLALVDREIFREELRASDVITEMACDRIRITYALRKLDGKAIILIEAADQCLIMLPEGFD